MNSHSQILPKFFKKCPNSKMTDFSIYACYYTVHCTVLQIAQEQTCHKVPLIRLPLGLSFAKYLALGKLSKVMRR